MTGSQIVAPTDGLLFGYYFSDYDNFVQVCVNGIMVTLDDFMYKQHSAAGIYMFLYKGDIVTIHPYGFFNCRFVKI